MACLRIVDATLREGAQAPGVQFTLAQALRVAKALDEIGVDAIECGHALIGGDTLRRIEALSSLGLRAALLSHARAKQEDVRAAKASGAGWIGVFCGINEKSRETRLGGRSPAVVLDMVRAAISLAKDLGLQVRYTVEDATRTHLPLALEAFAAAVEAGADRICYADTVGAASPSQFAHDVQAVRAALPDTDLEVHVHDDRGFATANAWGAVEAGATWISASVNGLGERCGVADLATMLANLDFAGLRPLMKGAELQRLSAYVGAIADAAPDARRPVVGRHAFTHTARLHAIAVRRDPSAYTAFDPKRVGRTTAIVASAAPAMSDEGRERVRRSTPRVLEGLIEE
jgi:2-isopropylmalate synthase